MFGLRVPDGTIYERGHEHMRDGYKEVGTGWRSRLSLREVYDGGRVIAAFSTAIYANEACQKNSARARRGLEGLLAHLLWR